MRERDFRALKGWVDYERPQLATLNKSQEIRYFKRRVTMTVLLPLRRMCRDDKLGWNRESPLLCFGTCICCAIEAMGKFLTGQLADGNSAKNFKAFVVDYMSQDWRVKHLASTPYVDILWKSFRNGLAHGFTIKQGGFERSSSYFQVKTIGAVQLLEVDPDSLLRDFENGVRHFIANLNRVPPADRAYQQFHNAFHGIFVLGK
jgi:hypothetical protein